MTAKRAEGLSKRRSVVLLSLALGTALSAVVALTGTARQAEAADQFGGLALCSLGHVSSSAV